MPRRSRVTYGGNPVPMSPEFTAEIHATINFNMTSEGVSVFSIEDEGAGRYKFKMKVDPEYLPEMGGRSLYEPPRNQEEVARALHEADWWLEEHLLLDVEEIFVPELPTPLQESA